jgi:HlyD family secretion protein
MKAKSRTPMQRSIRRHLIAGVGAAVLLAGGVGGWAATTEFMGAVVAPGQVVVDSEVKKVQHLTGGVVSELRVRDGDHVTAGDILLRLDDTETRASLAIVTKALDELAARRAREEAERDGAGEIAFPAELLARRDDPEVAHAIDGERRLFDIRRAARIGEKAQLHEQVNQLHQQIRGMQEQIDAKAKEIDWNDKELTATRSLWDKKLTQFTKVSALEQAGARLIGERGQLIASVAQARGRIAETELKILQVDEYLRTEVGRDLADIRARTSELVERETAARDQLRRTDLRAPQDGFVHQLDVHTLGAVIRAGDTVMVIVPDSDALTVEAKVRPQDIDQLHVGQAAVLRVAAFNQRTTPELNGQVKLVSADVSVDAKTGAAYYTIRITVPEQEIARLGGLKLMPGMPIEAFVQTTPRTVLSYLVRPLQDQIERSFRER